MPIISPPGDYDSDGWADLFVAHYVDFHLDDLPTFGSRKTCQYHNVAVQCGPRGLKGFRDNLYCFRMQADFWFLNANQRSNLRIEKNGHQGQEFESAVREAV